MRKFIYSIIGLTLIFSIFVPLAQAVEEVKLYFFYGQGCPHCAAEEVLLNKLTQEYPQLKVISYEVWYNSENLNLLKKVGEGLKADVGGVPFTVIGDQTISGYFDEETTGQQIRQQVERCVQLVCPDLAGEIIRQSQPGNQNQNINQSNDQGAQVPEKITLPFIGQIRIKDFSLPAITVIFGALDGFNPCAMWVLIFLISLLIKMTDRRKMWILGTTFIVASAAVYFMFMVAWLNLLTFLGFIIWVRIAIGLVALYSGYLNLREFVKNKDASCKVTDNEKRRNIMERLINISRNEKFILALGGIIILAFAVNLVELFCSLGLPTIFIQLLTLNHVSGLSSFLYILLYLFFFMLDDLIIFIVAMLTLRATGLTTKYTRYSNLIGGIIMLLIGLLMLLKPGWLMFG